MKLTRQPLILALSLSAALALAGCGKSPDDAASQVPASPPPSATVVTPIPEAQAPAAASTAMGNSVASGDMSSTVMVANVALGAKVDAATSKVTVSADSFAPADAIYAVVDTRGLGNATLSAKWSYQDGQVVHQDSKSITSNGPQTTAFMISKPSGFPAGNYKVDISLDGKQVTSKDFAVK
jgi:hypothetical protein